jgi:UDP-2,3-diacylglucosamine pyrophosphatase LpxH
MLVFISDIHLRAGGRTNVPRVEQLKRFWQRIEGARRTEQVTLAFVGDTFDLVRDPSWFSTPHRPYHPMSPELAAQIEAMIDATLLAERDFFTVLRKQVESGALDVEIILGNHDHLLNQVPKARAAIRKALGTKGGTAEFPLEVRYEKEGVLAYHGHVADLVSSSAHEDVPFAELFCPELITRFPLEIRRQLELQHAHLDDIDDVRPVVAVPTWVRTLAQSEGKAIGEKINGVWAGLVEEFLDNPHVVSWFKRNHKTFRFDFAQKMKVLLAMSARRGLREQARFAAAHDVLFRLLDTKFSATAAKKLEQKENKHLRHVVNGHTHFANMTPLGTLNGQRACYFNLGTWRTVHELGHLGTPSFMPFDAMGYLAFFGKNDPLGRELEWWQGAVLPRGE